MWRNAIEDVAIPLSAQEWFVDNLRLFDLCLMLCISANAFVLSDFILWMRAFLQI